MSATRYAFPASAELPRPRFPERENLAEASVRAQRLGVILAAFAEEDRPLTDDDREALQRAAFDVYSRVRAVTL